MIIDPALLDDAFDVVKTYPFQIAGFVIGFFSFQFDFLSYDLFTRFHFIAIIFGFAVGSLVDFVIKRKQKDPLAKLEKLRGRRRIQYLRVLFSVMGHIAKADGRVSEDEIKVARGIMAELKLNKDEVGMAIKAFTNGKSQNYPLSRSLYDFYQNFRFNISLRDRFMRVQIQAVLAGDGVSRIVDKLLHATAAQLDIPNQRIKELLKEARIHNSFTAYGRKTEKTHSERRRYQGSRYDNSHDDNFSQQRQREYQQGHSSQTAQGDALAEAYILLGVSVGDDEKAIKRAYRRLASQYHPDKMIGRGANRAERELAHAKTIEIREAYELIKKTRGF